MGVKVSFKFSIANLHSNEFPAAVQHFLRTVLACSPIFSTPGRIPFDPHELSCYQCRRSGKSGFEGNHLPYIVICRVFVSTLQVNHLWSNYFSSMKKITLTTIKIINDRVFPNSAWFYEVSDVISDNSNIKSHPLLSPPEGYVHLRLYVHVFF